MQNKKENSTSTGDRVLYIRLTLRTTMKAKKKKRKGERGRERENDGNRGETISHVFFFLLFSCLQAGLSIFYELDTLISSSVICWYVSVAHPLPPRHVPIENKSSSHSRLLMICQLDCCQ